MNGRNMIPFIAVIMMLTLMVAPVCSEDTEAATGDVILYSNTSELELKSGSSSVIQVIISNTTGNTYDIRMTSSHDNGDYKISYDVSEFILEADGIQTVNVTLKTEKYSERADDILTIGVECFSFDSLRFAPLHGNHHPPDLDGAGNRTLDRRGHPDLPHDLQKGQDQRR